VSEIVTTMPRDDVGCSPASWWHGAPGTVGVRCVECHTKGAFAAASVGDGGLVEYACCVPTCMAVTSMKLAGWVAPALAVPGGGA
jgi:hypothetical protein